MNKKIIGLSIGSLLSVSAFAGDYFGVSYKMVEISGGGASVEPSAVEVKYGHMLTKNIALESRFGIGIADDDDLEIDSMVGVYGAYHFDLDSIVTPYAMIGFSSTEIGVSGSSGSLASNDFSIGLGANIEIDDKSSINIEYVDLFDNEGLEGSALSAGWTYSF